MLDSEGSTAPPVLKRVVPAGQPLAWNNLELPARRMMDLWAKQTHLFKTND